MGLATSYNNLVVVAVAVVLVLVLVLLMMMLKLPENTIYMKLF